MNIKDLPEEEQNYFREMRAIVKDDEGREVLVGLTAEESSVYLSYLQRMKTGQRDAEETAEYLRLHEKHNNARFQVLGAEHVLRTEKPSRH